MVYEGQKDLETSRIVYQAIESQDLNWKSQYFVDPKLLLFIGIILGPDLLYACHYNSQFVYLLFESKKRF